MLRAFAKRAQLARGGVQPSRSASTSTGGIFGQGEPVTYAGVTIHKPSKFNTWMAEFIGAQLWFWLLYRGYHDWELFVYGLPAQLDKELEAEGWDPETSED